MEEAFRSKAEDPFLVGEAFSEACSGPAARFGFGHGEEGLKRMLAAIRPFADEPSVARHLSALDDALHLGLGSVLSIADSL